MAEAEASCPPVDQQVRVVVARPAFTQQQFQKQYDYTEPKPKSKSWWREDKGAGVMAAVFFVGLL